MSTAKHVAEQLLRNGDYARKKEELEAKQTTLQNGKRFLIDMSHQVDILAGELKALETVDTSLEEKLIEELAKVQALPMVTEAQFEGTKIWAKTDWMVAYTQNDDPFPIPPAVVTLNLSNSDFRATALNRSEGVRGIWTDHDVHPHIAGDSGSPCIGDASCSITAMIAEKEYYAAFLMCIDFMQAANEDDSAGSKWPRWRDKHKEKLDELLA